MHADYIFCFNRGINARSSLSWCAVYKKIVSFVLAVGVARPYLEDAKFMSTNFYVNYWNVYVKLAGVFESRYASQR